jgi:transposase
VQLTATCDPDEVRLITRVDTTQAAVADVDRTAGIHAALAERGLLPSEHFVDAGYVDATPLVASRAEHGLDLVGPVRPDVGWQARQGEGDDVSTCAVDWAARRVTRPQGQTGTARTPHADRRGNQAIRVKFPRRACRHCPQHDHRTRAVSEPRHLTLRPGAEHDAL